jgi:hypothetical protein
MSEQVLMPPVKSDANVRGPLGIRRKSYKPKKVTDPNEEPVFQRIADTPYRRPRASREVRSFPLGLPVLGTTSRSTWSPP